MPDEVVIHLTAIEVSALDGLRELHAPDPWSGHWCNVCLEAGSMDSEKQLWPCETAQLVYSSEAIARIRFELEFAEAKAREARITAGRTATDKLIAEQPEAFWQDVAITRDQWETQQAMRMLWSKEILFQSTPLLRYESVTHADGSVDDHLQTGRFAKRKRRKR